MSAILLAAIAILGAVRARRRPAAALPAAIAAIGLLLDIVVRGPRILEWQVTIIDALLGVAAIALVADVVGLPHDLARRTGIGLRSRAWGFDGALYRALAPLNDQLTSGPDPTDLDDYVGWRNSTVTAGRQIVERVRNLHAPDPGWSDLRDRYVEVYGILLDSLDQGDTSRNDEIHRLNEAIDLQRANLRRRYREEADG